MHNFLSQSTEFPLAAYLVNAGGGGVTAMDPSVLVLFLSLTLRKFGQSPLCLGPWFFS